MSQLIAVVGVGSIGARYCVWLAEAGNRVVVVDADADAARKAADACAGTVADLDQLASLGVAGAVIATPPMSHRQIVEHTLAAGIPTLVEKPMAGTREDGQAMARLAREVGVPLYVVCNMRFHPGPATIKREFPRIGQPLFARAHFGHRLSQMRGGRDTSAVYAAQGEAGGGAVLDCIHEIDLQQHLFGEAELEAAVAATLGPEMVGAEDYSEIVLSFGSGVRASLHLDLLQRWKRRGWEVVGTDATLIWYSEGRAPERCTVVLATQSEEQVVLSLESVDASQCYREMLEKFVAGIASGRVVDELQGPEEGLRALEIALAARQGKA